MPSFLLSLYYPPKQKTVKLGNKIKPKAVRSFPNVYLSSASATRTSKPSSTLTLVLTDPDATSHAEPIMAQMCHWIVANITVPSLNLQSQESFDLGSAMTTAGHNGVLELESYLPPSPPPKTSYHRYVFVLLESDPSSNAPKLPLKPRDRPHWGYGKLGAGVREWADENSLRVVGEFVGSTSVLRNTYHEEWPEMNGQIANVCHRGQFFLFPEQETMTLIYQSRRRAVTYLGIEFNQR